MTATVWECSTAVHRDLYEEQILVGPVLASGLLDRCLVLSLLRLACINGELALIDVADDVSAS